MAQEIKQGNIFGRIGTGIGKGLAEQLPKTFEQGQLAGGLKRFEEDSNNLTPLQQGARLAAIPGITPQATQTLGNLAQQQAYLNSLKNQYEGPGGQKSGQGGGMPSPDEIAQPRKGELPTLANEKDTAESYKQFIPPTEQQERADAYENFKQNPARYNNNFDNALQERKAITARNQQIQQAHQGQEATAVAKEEKVKEGLQKKVAKVGLGKLPPKAYQNFEDRILQSMLSKNDGGDGLTQDQAIQKHTADWQQSTRDFTGLGSLSAWSPRDLNRRVDALQKSFASRDELQPAMDQFIADQGVSPTYAGHKFYPVKGVNPSTLDKFAIQVGTSARGGVSVPKINEGTYAQLTKEMGKGNSPLSIAYEIEQRGGDPRGFLDYLDNHREHLEGWQIDQLGANLNTSNLKDDWLRVWE